MTVAPIGNGMYIGTSSDTKPTTGVVTGALFIENNTGVISYYTGSTWTAVAGGGGGSGEANTASNTGTVGMGLFKTKSTYDLQFYKINSQNNLLTIALNGTDRVDLTVNQANLAIAYSQLTSVPSTIVETDQANSFGDFDQVFKDNRLLINNPADTFAYTLIAAAIGGNRTVTLPLLTSNDTAVTEAFAQPLSNKTMDAETNIFKNVVVEPSVKKTGWTIPSSLAGGIAKTALCQNVVDVGTITNVWDTTFGTVSQCATGTTSNSNAGQIHPATGTGAGRRSALANLRLKTACQRAREKDSMMPFHQMLSRKGV